MYQNMYFSLFTLNFSKNPENKGLLARLFEE